MTPPMVLWRKYAVPHLFACVISAVALNVHLFLSPWLGNRPSYVVFVLPIIFSAYVGGLGPGLLSTAICAGGVYYFLLAKAHNLLFFEGSADLWNWAALMATGALVSLLMEALHRTRKRAEAASRLQAVTLASIGDGVVTTDQQGRVTFLNAEAERLTGWQNAEACGRPLPEIFRIVNEITRQPVDDPASIVLATGLVAGLANHTLLLARNGKETLIEDSGAPIKDHDGCVAGVVLVFRDGTEKKQQEDALRESQALYHSLVEQLPAGIYRKDAAGRYVFVNSFYCAIRGGRPEQYLGKFPHELPAMGAVFRARAAEDHQQILRTGQSVELLDEYHRADGRTGFLQVLKTPVFDGNGKITGSQGILFDVTGRKRLEEELRAAGERMKFFMNRIPLGFIAWDREFRVAEWNAAAEVIFGCPATEAVGRPAQDLVGSAGPPGGSRRGWDQILGAGAMPPHFISDQAARDGRRMVCEWRNAPWRDAQGDICGWLSLVGDITEKNRAEENFAREQARFKLIFDTVPIAITFQTVHPDGARMRIVNDAHRRICGLIRGEPDDPGIYDRITHPDDRELARPLEQAVATGLCQQYSLEKRLVHADGRVVWVSYSYQSQRHLDGTREELITAIDITQRKVAEQRSRQLAVIVESSEDAIIGSTLEGIITSWNRGAESIFGYSAGETVGQSLLQLYPPELLHQPAELMGRIRRGESIEHFQTERIRKDGKRIRISATISPVRDGHGNIAGAAAIARDITRQHTLEEQLRQSQKMEAIGQLAGGVAHDFNNILAVIQMQVELFKCEAHFLPDQASSLDVVQNAASRGANLTRQLLLFSRRQRLQPRDLDLCEAIASMAKMFRRILGEDIQIHFKYGSQPLFIHADASMVDQILMNLTLNSRDAMPRGGQLVIEAAAAEIDDLAVLQFPQARTGRFVRLTVSDTGCGIRPEVLPHVFEPFFTTKEVGKGTGLGLATVFSIVQQHQGWIQVDSQPGQGATFNIFLPRLAKDPVLPAEPPDHLAAVNGGTETILLVEDDDDLRASVHQCLSQLGYRLFEAATGPAALRLWHEQRGQIQLLLTDLIMPGGMTGKELGEQLRQADPQLKVIYVSGYCADLFARDLPPVPGIAFLPKPFAAHALARTVRACLDEK